MSFSKKSLSGFTGQAFFIARHTSKTKHHTHKAKVLKYEPHDRDHDYHQTYKIDNIMHISPLFAD